MNRKPMIVILCVLSLFILMSGVIVNASPLYQNEGEIELVLPEVQEDEAAAEMSSNETIILVTENDSGDDEEIVTKNEGTGAEEAVEENFSETEEGAEDVKEPGVPIPENPKGSFSSHAMGFYWTPAENTDRYEVYWRNDKGNQDTLQLENDDWTCQMNRCIVYTELPSDGNYTWVVTAFNENGNVNSDEAAFTVNTSVPSPDAYRPNTALDGQKPLIFEWEDLGSNVSDYRIQIADSVTDLVVFDKRCGVDTVLHINGECYLETGEYLSEGTYQWRVQGINGTASSEWSQWMAFRVSCALCSSGTYQNSTSAVLYPRGVALDGNPSFTWKSLTGALSYQIDVKDSNGEMILSEEVLPNRCLIETCSFVPEISLTPGEMYTWTVGAYGWNGSFWGADDDSFVVTSVPEMKDFSFVGPESNTSLDPDNQQIIWTDPGVNTPVFRLGIRDENDEWQFITDLTREEAWCDSVTCSIQFQSIPTGEDYEIVLIPYSEYNTPGEAVALTFNNK